MQILTGIEHIGPFAGGIVSIGNFDGVHRGHQAMLQTLVMQAKSRQVPAVAMTFDPPPVALIAPQRVPPRLNTIARKADLMSQLGVDCLLVYPTDREFLNLTPDKFFQSIVLDRLKARGLVEGENFCFGKHRAGTSQLLRQYCEEHDLSLHVISPVQSEGITISSTKIRELISAGQLESAVELLGHPYRLTGKVVTGAKRGRLLGFPTANLHRVETLIPDHGVYAGFCEFHGQVVPAAVHIGKNPTFADDNQKIEVHLIKHEADLYGQTLSVDLFARCRPVQWFENGEALRQQLQRDIEQVLQMVHLRFGQEG